MALRRIALTYLLFLFLQILYSQNEWLKAEEVLAYHCDVMTNASNPRHRVTAMNAFNEEFYKALEKSGSFYHPFDSLKWISKKYPEDKSFRIFTWETKTGEGDVRYFGILQKSDGKCYKLEDNFKLAESLADEEFGCESWLGAVYYNLMEINDDTSGKYYLLFGMNRWNAFENVKLIDVLFFSTEGIPYFGKPLFRRTEAGQKDVIFHRLIFKYSSDAQMTVNYNPGMGMIMVDNLVARMSRIPGQGETMVPDGSYVGYEWDKKYWNRIDKIANEVMETAPRPKPVLDKRKGKKIFGN